MRNLNTSLNKSIRSSSYDEEVEGNPWAVVPIKTRLYAKNTIEIELSNRKITKLAFFNQFENLEALWLNNNKLKKIEGLDSNFRLKQLFVSKNRLITLEGSLSVMKFLTVLLVDNNKLRNLDKQLGFLKELPFLQNLNLFNNPLAEEPEYRFRVIFNIPSLHILDRHKITDVEKNKAEVVVPEYMNPLSKTSLKNGIKSNSNSSRENKTSSKDQNLELSTHDGKQNEINKQLKLRRPIVHSQKILMTISKSHMKPVPKDPNKYLKSYEKMSITEKEMFIEGNKILEKREAEKKLKEEKRLNQLKERDLKDFDLPFNKAVESNKKNYLKENSTYCKEMEINEIRRLYHLYDPSKKLFYFI